MPRTRTFKKKEEKTADASSITSTVGKELLTKELIPQPFLNFIKIMVPQIKKFENKTK